MRTPAKNDKQLQRQILKDMQKMFKNFKVDTQEALGNSLSLTGVPQNAGGIGDVKNTYPVEISPLMFEMHYEQGALSPSISTEPVSGSWSDMDLTHHSPIGSDPHNFLELINEGLGGSLAYFNPNGSNPTMSPRPFWTEFETNMDKNYKQMIKKSMLAVGMPVI